MFTTNKHLHWRSTHVVLDDGLVVGTCQVVELGRAYCCFFIVAFMEHCTGSVAQTPLNHTVFNYEYAIEYVDGCTPRGLHANKSFRCACIRTYFDHMNVRVCNIKDVSDDIQHAKPVCERVCQRM
jgi:hypothetical protein